MRRLIAFMSRMFVLVALFGAATSAFAQIALTDLKGRTVLLEKPAQRLAVDDGRMIIALSFLAKDPVSLLAAWPHDINRLGIEQHAALQARFPALDGLATIGSNAGDMAVEPVIAARPDLVVLSIFSKVSGDQINQLQAAGIPVIYVDFLLDPVANTDKSLLLLGEATGHRQQAETVVNFRKRHRDAIGVKLAALDPTRRKPAVFLETHASASEGCCNSPGTGNLGQFIDMAGGDNIGDILKGRPFGQIDLEYVLATRPDIYIASGGAYMEKRSGLLIGPDYDAAATRASLEQLLARPGFSALPAVENGNVHGLAKQLFDPVFDVLALELLAKWINPQLFHDLDVDATRVELNRFSALPLASGYWLN